MTEPKTTRQLSATQIRAARLLAGGATGADTAKALRVRAETVSRWRREPAFLAEIRRAAERGTALPLAERLAALAPQALETLARALHDRGNQWGRLAAAVAILLLDAIGHTAPGDLAPTVDASPSPGA